MEEYIYTIYGDLPRQGPGGNRWTAKAFSFIDKPGSIKKILDLGCGTGMQTLELLRNSEAHITAVDVHEPFLDVLRQKAGDEGFGSRLSTLCMPMEELPLEKEAYDLIWSEGALYNMGVEKGLEKFYDFICKGGFFVFSDVVWIKNDPPEEVLNFWQEEYPGMKQQFDVHRIARGKSYDSVGCLALPDEAWWVHYYNYLIENIADARKLFGGNSEAMKIIESTEREIEIRRLYAAWYSYVFYIFKKT